MQTPDYLFEVSWEVCNKVGGIHTVLSTKAKTLTDKFKNQYILIGPDIWQQSTGNPEFTEDKYLFKSWRDYALTEGLKIRIGRWNIPGNPIVILLDFTPYFQKKDDIFADLYVKYQVDSLSGQWDYVEPALFGYGAGKVIESYCYFHLGSQEKIVAQFHEWMTGAGILFLKENTPNIATMFITHATVAGRAIAGNGLPLYKQLKNHNGEQLTKDFNCISKHSLEKSSAKNADCFATVSEITGTESKYLLEKETDVITPNGFEDSYIPGKNEFEKKRNVARKKLLQIASAVTNSVIPDDSFLIATSGRYEFQNKGIDCFLNALKVLVDKKFNKSITCFLLIPANQKGPRKDVVDKLNNTINSSENKEKFLTHNLHEEEHDIILKTIKQLGFNNSAESKIKLIFVPVYLNGYDGVFNVHYYDLLIGFDLTVFASYYEPWGYTPLESIAFHIPTITTTLAGFGKWVLSQNNNKISSIEVLQRDDDNFNDVVQQIAVKIESFTNINSQQLKKLRDEASDFSKKALWKNLIHNYYQAFDIALGKIDTRKELILRKQKTETQLPVKSETIIKQNQPVWKRVLVRSEIPEELSALKKIAFNVWWSWNYEVYEIFDFIDKALWEQCHYNPVRMLEEMRFEHFQSLLTDSSFLQKLKYVENKFNQYMNTPLYRETPQVAFLCMEYGFHSSIHLYSGGLGVLAGDFLKEASDSGYRVHAVGLLFRQGYFKQSISIGGGQEAIYQSQQFSYLPLIPLKDKEDNWIKITFSFPGRNVIAKAWKIEVGRVNLYLLDTDVEENTSDDRHLTYQLYGGDSEMRLKQELILGIGGIRLLDRLEIKPDIFHCNEGHAAFMGFERLRKYIQEDNLTFNEALEVVRASSLFTTHTPVPAGHDTFTEDLMRAYLSGYASQLFISWEQFMNLGRADENDASAKFSMSNLAIRMCQEINSVSKIHEAVSRKMFNSLWSGYGVDELPIKHVTNGVHYYTWTAREWQQLYKNEFGEMFLSHQSDKTNWSKIHQADDGLIWKIRKTLKNKLNIQVKKHLKFELNKRIQDPGKIFEILNKIPTDSLIIGFSRRFATYKRATLIFKNLPRLASILNNPTKPVQIIFAGKAHPRDIAGQEYIRRIIEVSEMPEFLGKVHFLENYDIELASLLVQGVDVWLNTPMRPLEASGTSGMKATLNGVLNLSILDGWWAEGYKEGTGWALPEEPTYENADFQDLLDAETIYELLENEVVPTYYERNSEGIPLQWIKRIKNTIAEIAPLFTMKRQIDEYYHKLYIPLHKRSQVIQKNYYEAARKIAAWKKKMILAWDSIEVKKMEVYDTFNKPLQMGENFEAFIELDLKELSPEDIGLEIVLTDRKSGGEVREIIMTEVLKSIPSKNNICKYICKFPIKRAGVFEYGFRIYPNHPQLPYRQDFNLLKWI